MNVAMVKVSSDDSMRNVQVSSDTGAHFATKHLTREPQSRSDDIQLALRIEQMVGQDEGALSKLYEVLLNDLGPEAHDSQKLSR